MRRKTLDALLTTGGFVLTAVLLVAGGLLMWASNFVQDNVHSQLADQKITMPSGKAIEDPAIKPYLQQYAGQQMTTGAQAKAYADHYILVHMNKAGQGRTYEEVSGEFIALSANPNADKAKVAELGQLRQTLFMGNTLRGLLLNAYAFGTMGTIAFWGAVASFVGAAFLFLLSLLGLRHERHVPVEQEVRIGRGAAAAPAVG
ncbi:hypothetical protein [Phycicoccus sp. 3266]|uniref:hypothetical protein n=1 Tax=Phycicoccus sp. 3266 TaxID=2817751 RepID=UPI0028556120|nr:hypothetical protein [Phycicoccus sp. 3266]MDR6862730.1 hypothetical protein [Phycicoccus sp. 3266]